MRDATFIAAACCFVLFGASATAQPLSDTNVSTGYIGAAYEWVELETPSGDADTEGVAFSGSIVLEDPMLQRFMGAGAAMQIDGSYLMGEDDSDAVSVTAHFFKRNDQWLYGGYVSFADFEDVGVVSFGGELNHYMDDITLAGSVGWISASDVDTDAFVIGAEGRYFVNENLRVDAGVGWADFHVDGAEAETAVLLSVGAEQQLADTPISVFANFTSALFDDDVDSNHLMAGVRYNFSPTLRDRDRRGVSLNQAPLAARLII